MRLVHSPDVAELPRTTRYEPRRILGRGGMGFVYEAWDRVRRIPVAIKMLEGQSPAMVHRLKREFRSIADISHPNLVTLHSLLQSSGTWLLVMDLVDGVNFLDFVRLPGIDTADDAGPRDFRDIVDEERLRTGLGGVVSAVQTLHETGWLHRDLKPSNVLGSANGHVTVLDFGLVREDQDTEASVEMQVVGTPVYMAPEQAAGDSPGPAADWYSVGVMLYQSLTGRLPFSGSVLQILGAKQVRDATPMSEFVRNVPDDLNDLCHRLLSREATARPGPKEILETLLSEQPPAAQASDRPSRPSGFRRSNRPTSRTLFGRDQELENLRRAFRESERSGPSVVQIVAPSGLGKTALVHHFLEECREQEAAVLTGRCFERESVPFKGVDGAVDSLVRFLRQLDDVDATALLPREAFALRSVFPALERVEVVARVPAPRRAIPDAAERRRRAFLALKELLARLADRRFTVLFLDDVQWGDADGGDLVAELLRGPDAPRMLLVAASRPGEPSPLLAALGGPPLQHAIRLSPLEPEAARAFARHLLHDERDPGVVALSPGAKTRPIATEAQATALAHESAGNPLFVQELAHHLLEHYDMTTPVKLEDALRQRVRALPTAQQTLLSTIAVAARPLAAEFALRAADLGRAGERALKALYAARLICSSDTARSHMVEAQHDRVREVAWLETRAEERRRLHGRLADVLIDAESADAETIAVHLEEGGRTEDALRYAIDAAQQAARSLAFDRAARLYKTAIRLFEERPNHREVDATNLKARYRLELGLAESLAAVGRGQEAAEAYLRAASLSKQDQMECKRCAAEHYLRSGHMDRGMTLLMDVLRDEGLSLANTPADAALKTLYHRAKRSLLGIHFERRPHAAIGAHALRTVDLAWTVSNGLSLIDKVRAAEFHARHLPLVLRTGDPFRAARVLSLEGAHVAAEGQKARRASAALIRRAELIAKQHHDQEALAWVLLTKGTRAYLLQRFRDCYDYTQEADAFFRDRCQNVAWESATASGFHFLAAAFLGKLDYLAKRLPAYVTEVEQRGDLFARSTATTGISILAWLCRDQVDQARSLLAKVAHQCEGRPFILQHSMLMLGDVYLNHYTGNHELAYRRLRETWKPAKRAYLHFIEVLRVQSWALRGLSALASAERSAFKDAQRCLRAISREPSPMAQAYTPLLRAGIAHKRNDISLATKQLEEASEAFRAAEMLLHAHAADLFHGRLDQASDRTTNADRWFQDQGVVHPVALARSVIPAFETPSGGKEKG